MAENKNTKVKNRNPFLIIFILLLSIISLFFIAQRLVPRVIVYLTQAARSNKYSLSNSYVFGAPLSAPADGKTRVMVNAFVLNDEGRGVEDVTVELQVVPKEGSTGTPQVNQVQPVTDNFGKAVFEVSSTSVGQYVATAVVDGMEIPQTVTLTFR
jgi:hypothetical protein